MVIRKIIKINDEKCNGCGACIPNCPEGAIQMIDGKARLISDLFCDGLGACIGTCPLGAIEIEERESEKYDEKKVLEENIISKGENTILAHLAHLKDHGEVGYLKEAIQVLEDKGFNVPVEFKKPIHEHVCPGMKLMEFGTDEKEKVPSNAEDIPSTLRQWPIQLHLVSPFAPYFQGRDILLAADCVAFSLGNFHHKFLKGKSLAIACPKLDSNKDVYVEKIRLMIEDSKINSLMVMIMEVPCCGGLLMLANEALNKSKRKIPIKKITVGIKGDILSEEII